MPGLLGQQNLVMGWGHSDFRQLENYGKVSNTWRMKIIIIYLDYLLTGLIQQWKRLVLTENTINLSQIRELMYSILKALIKSWTQVCQKKMAMFAGEGFDNIKVSPIAKPSQLEATIILPIVSGSNLFSGTSGKQRREPYSRRTSTEDSRF